MFLNIEYMHMALSRKGKIWMGLYFHDEFCSSLKNFMLKFFKKLVGCLHLAKASRDMSFNVTSLSI